MKMKTSELTGLALDWAVAKCEKVDEYILYESFMSRWTDEEGDTYQYSTDWAQGGPIIEREEIDIQCFPRKNGTKVWRTFYADGSTPLIASMRCYVASKLGDEVEIPDELTKGESK